jgi:hypothetical protein
VVRVTGLAALVAAVAGQLLAYRRHRHRAGFQGPHHRPGSP